MHSFAGWVGRAWEGGGGARAWDRRAPARLSSPSPEEPSWRSAIPGRWLFGRGRYDRVWSTKACFRFSAPKLASAESGIGNRDREAELPGRKAKASFRTPNRPPNRPELSPRPLLPYNPCLMSAALEIINIVVPVFLVIALGQVLTWRKFFSDADVRQMSRTVFYVATPLLLFRSAAQTSPAEALNIPALLAITAITTGLAIVFYLAAFRAVPARRGVLAQGTFRSNLVFVGFPIILNAFGEKGIGLASIYVGFITVLYNFLAVFLLTLPHQGEGEKIHGLPILKSIATNPLILSCLAGILFATFHIPLPTVLDRAVKLGGDLATPLALLVVGASLDLKRVRSEVAAALLVSGFKLGVYPAMIFAALWFLGLRGMAVEVPTLLLASPTAVVSYVMAREMKGDDQLAGAIVIGSTLLSLFGLSAWLAFFQFMR